MDLKRLGFNEKVQKALYHCRKNLNSSLKLGRVFQDAYHIYRLLDGEREVRAVLSGRLKHRAKGKSDLPVVGDWVLFEEKSGKARILELIPRYSSLSRKVVGDLTKEQVLAANIDTVFFVTTPDGDFNPRRIERFLTLSAEGGVKPVILLNKSDLSENIKPFLDKIHGVANAVEVHAVSVLNRFGLEVLHRYLYEGLTFALVGSSGVGKSSIINALLGKKLFEVGEVHRATSQGKHTTTRREMVFTPSGAMLIDTPGLRELQIWAETDSVERNFSDIERLARTCYFRNCTHGTEPGCAVQEAVKQGRLEAERVESFRKQISETKRLLLKKREFRKKKENRKPLKKMNEIWKN